MCPSQFGDRSPQAFYHPEDQPTMPSWFKGMQGIIEEHGLWPDSGLPSQCHGFKCEARHSDCCCWWLLFMQCNFCSQRSQLEEYITARGHICDFYPKYYCELNFIEQNWGVAKFMYQILPCTTNIDEMERNMLACLDNVPLSKILRCS